MRIFHSLCLKEKAKSRVKSRDEAKLQIAMHKTQAIYNTQITNGTLYCSVRYFCSKKEEIGENRNRGGS
jgi:hypothetical protein